MPRVLKIHSLGGVALRGLLASHSATWRSASLHLYPLEGAPHALVPRTVRCNASVGRGHPQLSDKLAISRGCCSEIVGTHKQGNSIFRASRSTASDQGGFSVEGSLETSQVNLGEGSPARRADLDLCIQELLQNPTRFLASLGLL